MRAAITAVLPEPAPAITWTGPIGAVIAAHCSDVGSRSLSALRMLAVAAVAVRLALMARLLGKAAAAPARPRWWWWWWWWWWRRRRRRWRRRVAAPARAGPRPAATS